MARKVYGRGAAAKRKPSAPARAGPLIPDLLTPARKREILGSALVAVGVVTLVSLVSGRGELTSAWVSALEDLTGRGHWLLPALVGGTGAWLLIDSMDDAVEVRLRRPLGGLVLFLALITLWQMAHAALNPDIDRAAMLASGEGGGRIGRALAEVLGGALGAIPAAALLLLVGGAGLGTLAGLSLREMLDRLGQGIFDGGSFLWSRRDGVGRGLKSGSQALLDRLSPSGQPPPDAPAMPASFPVQTAFLDPARAGDPATPAVAAATAVPAAPPPAPSDITPLPAASTGWQLPAAEALLDPPVDVLRTPDESDRLARIIEQTLGEFGIPVEVVQINVGPTITQFGLRPGYTEKAGIRSKVAVRRILALQNDLALALAASPVRILAPVPGRPYVGVEVPNASKSVVSLRGVMQSEAFQRILGPGGLPIALGRDTGGNDVAVDLTRMPHLLIAGATGSGKSVCVNTLIASLLLTHTPETLKMVLVDPKRVEMTQYRGLPHLATPVVVDAERVVGVLQWAVREMDRRYRAFAEAGARNVAAYNRLMAERGQARLPFLVVVIDELADLMMLAPEETERLITRLAQLARATGIHLVLATQRPSVDVVTGLIKANFPSRIAFAVSSSIDSRVILDQQGAEKLLGQGDMLYQSSDDSKLRRLQGCYVSDEEIERLVHFWKFKARPEGEVAKPSAAATLLGIPEPMIQPELWEQMTSPQGGALSPEKDPLWDEAVALIRSHSAASTSFLQRKLKIGYSRAARLIDELEQAGLVGPAQGRSPREVTILEGQEDPTPPDYRERLDQIFGPEPGRGTLKDDPDFLPPDLDARLLAPVPLPWPGPRPEVESWRSAAGSEAAEDAGAEVEDLGWVDEDLGGDPDLDAEDAPGIRPWLGR